MSIKWLDAFPLVISKLFVRFVKVYMGKFVIVLEVVDVTWFDPMCVVCFVIIVKVQGRDV